MQEGSVLHLRTKFEADCSIRSKVIKGAPKFVKLGEVTRPLPLRGHFMVLMQEGSVLYACTKIEADSYFRSKVIRGVPKF